MHNGTIGSVLCSLRKQNVMTQKELAKNLSVHITTIKNWESGNCYPDAKNVCALADLFHVTTDYLLNDDYESDDDIPAVQTATKETKDLYTKKKQHHLIAAICFTIASFCWLMSVLIYVDDNQLVLSCFALALCSVNAVVQFVLFAKKGKAGA